MKTLHNLMPRALSLLVCVLRPFASMVVRDSIAAWLRARLFHAPEVFQSTARVSLRATSA